MASVISWIAANWQPLAIAILAFDAALIPVFPQAGFLVSIKNFLSGLGVKPPSS